MRTRQKHGESKGCLMAYPCPCPGHTHYLQHGSRLQVGNNPVGSGGSASIVKSTLGLQVHPQVHMILADADVVYREFHSVRVLTCQRFSQGFNYRGKLL